jgi:hypothetical protein
MNGSSPQSFELAGQDFGPVDPAGFVNNFAMGALRIEPLRTVTMIDAVDNYPGGTPCEVLYVDTLSLGAGSTLVLTGCNVYYRTLIKESGAIVMVSNGAALISTNSGDLDNDNDMDLDDLDLFVTVLLGGSCNAICLGRADVNGDVVINGSDLPLFVRLLTGW